MSRTAKTFIYIIRRHWNLVAYICYRLYYDLDRAFKVSTKSSDFVQLDFVNGGNGLSLAAASDLQSSVDAEEVSVQYMSLSTVSVALSFGRTEFQSFSSVDHTVLYIVTGKMGHYSLWGRTRSTDATLKRDRLLHPPRGSDLDAMDMDTEHCLYIVYRTENKITYS